MSYLFFTDESGQDGKNTPHVVVGGFGIDESDYPAFEEAVKACFFDCFGINLADFVELKGASLLKIKVFKWAKSRAKMSDEVRKMHIKRFLSKEALNSPLDGDDYAAYGQACILFIECVFKILSEYNCKICASVTSFAHYKTIFKYKEGDESHFTTHMLRDLEFELYRNIFLFSQKKGNVLVTSDATQNDYDNKRVDFFNKSVSYFENIYSYLLPEENTSFSFEIHNSKSNIGLQIADIIIYVINYGLILNDKILEAIVPRFEIYTIANKYININAIDYYDDIAFNFHLDIANYDRFTFKLINWLKEKPRF